ncbi:MAG TPA: hypothetical protein VHX42_05075 [Candidatus Babeliales bacterium]|jgi:hypothetical protein|nr:hypothetical protein [Candidatus Babeliales bacterium]
MFLINENKFNKLWNISRYVYGLVPIIIGIDKFTFYIVNWYIYVSPFVASLIAANNLVSVLGVIEITTGLLILTKWPRPGAYAVVGLLSLVIVNLFLLGDVYDIILRDVAIAFGYIVFGVLTDLKEHARYQP